MTLGQIYLQEFEAEVTATRKCIERVPDSLYNWKPHEKSMQMGYLTQILAEMPKWITTAVKIGEINFGTWQKYTLTTTADLVSFFDKNLEDMREVLKNATDEDLKKTFSLKSGEQMLMTDTVQNTVSSTINHMVHHRGQLTVYMRLNNIAVPSIYGPSADDKTF